MARRTLHICIAQTAVRLQLHALAYISAISWMLAVPETVETSSLTSLPENLIQDRLQGVSHGLYITFQMAEAAVPRQTFWEILTLIARLRALLTPA